MKKKTAKSKSKSEISRLKNELENALETLRAIQSGEVDALVVGGDGNERIFTLKSADLPYRILVETMNEGAATINPEGIVMYCNQRFAEMLGSSINHVIGTKIYNFISELHFDHFKDSFALAIQSRAKCMVDLLADDSMTVTAILSMSSVQLDPGAGVCVVATDLTEQRRLQEAREDVARLNLEKEMRERYVATLSHDLRNPLAAIKTSAQMIVRYPTQCDKHQLLGNRIVSNVDRADRMIQDLLDANRIRAGEKLALEITQCDLRQTTEDTITELTMVVGDRFVLDAEGPVIGYWSCEQLRRVVENLATNAVKYGAADTPVQIQLKAEKQEVAIRVHNEGEPLTKEEQSKLFNPFVRAQNAFLSRQKGWGLGLTLVRGVVEAHGGKVFVESAPKKGTTFTVKIPRDARPFQSAG